MKSKLNFKAIHENGEVYDMNDLSIWVESFHIHSPNPDRQTSTKSLGTVKKLKSTRQQERPVDIGLLIESDGLKEFDDLKHQIYSIFYSKKPIKIIRDLKPNRMLYVVQNSEYDIESITSEDGKLNLTLNMLDALLFSDLKTITVNKEEHHTVHGQESTPWTAKVTFGKDADKYELKGAYGRNITLHYSFVEGDVLKIDYAKRKVTLNDNDIATSIDLRTKWFELPTGNVKLEASHETEITYYERYY